MGGCLNSVALCCQAVTADSFIANEKKQQKKKQGTKNKTKENADMSCLVSEAERGRYSIYTAVQNSMQFNFLYTFILGPPKLLPTSLSLLIESLFYNI